MKKALSMVLLLSMLAGMLSIGAAAGMVVDDTFTLGDVNGDGVADPTDALEVARYLADVEGVNVIRDAADMDADGQVSAYDALQFKMCIAGAKDWSDYEITDGYGQALYNFTIAGNSITTYCIVVPEGTDAENSNLYYGADMLRKYTRMATGHNMEICFGTPSTENAVYFHQEDETGELGIEGYIYEVKDGQLHIYGTRRGNMYAAYDILEEYLGYRFFSTKEYRAYKSRTSDIAEGTYFKKIPELVFRMARQTAAENNEEFAFPRRLNGRGSAFSDDERHGTLTGAHFINAHSFGYYYRMATGPADAPTLQERYQQGIQRDEYSWQPCMTGEESYNQMFTGLKLTLDMIFVEWAQGTNRPSHVFRKGTSSMSFSICDNIKGYCKCADCATIYETDGYAGGSVYIANRAVKDIQQYYPGMKLYFIIYDHIIPQTIFPDEDLIVLFCGTGCNNHFIGSGECGDNVTTLGGNNTYDEKALKAWGDICRDTGAELWFWYYPVTYHYYLVGCPNIINLYYDYNYLINECGVSGIFYEGGGTEYNFETLKEYLAIRLNWDPEMTEEEFYGHIMEYLYLQYGDGNVELFDFIMMQNEAGDLAGCFINNYDRPRQMYNFEYIDNNYEEMRALLTAALEKAQTDEQRDRIETLIACFDFLGLTCVHHRYYKGNNEELRQLYMERYDNMYNYIKDNGMEIFSADEPYSLPSSISYIEDPMFQFYGEERDGVTRYP